MCVKTSGTNSKDMKSTFCVWLTSSFTLFGTSDDTAVMILHVEYLSKSFCYFRVWNGEPRVSHDNKKYLRFSRSGGKGSLGSSKYLRFSRKSAKGGIRKFQKYLRFSRTPKRNAFGNSKYLRFSRGSGKTLFGNPKYLRFSRNSPDNQDQQNDKLKDNSEINGKMEELWSQFDQENNIKSRNQEEEDNEDYSIKNESAESQLVDLSDQDVSRLLEFPELELPKLLEQYQFGSKFSDTQQERQELELQNLISSQTP